LFHELYDLTPEEIAIVEGSEHYPDREGRLRLIVR